MRCSADARQDMDTLVSAVSDEQKWCALPDGLGIQHRFRGVTGALWLSTSTPIRFDVLVALWIPGCSDLFDVSVIADRWWRDSLIDRPLVKSAGI